MKEKDINAMLDTLARDNDAEWKKAEAQFASEDCFIAEFFDKVEKMEEVEAQSKRRWSFFSWRVMSGVAAALAVLCCGVAWFSVRQRHVKSKVVSVSRADIQTAPLVDASKKDGTGSLSVKKVSPLFCCKESSGNGTVCGFRTSEGVLSSRAYSISDSLEEMPAYRQPGDFNTEEYKNLEEKPFVAVANSPLATFGADVDTASFANLRRMVMMEHRMPPKDAIRTEELLNSFTYDYAAPSGNDILKPNFEMMDAPWAKGHKLLLVGIQAKNIPVKDLPSSNFVFLIDNSGSMTHVFPLVKTALEGMAGKMRKGDRISIVTYGGGVSVPLENGTDAASILKVVKAMAPQGYTPGGAGIKKAYELAHRYFLPKGNNRIILITDGDFNVGASSESDLAAMVEKERKSAIYLSVIGVGMWNFKDSKLKMLANKGQGNYCYLDDEYEAKTILEKEFTGKMHTLARDVKFQVEFNPSKVHYYRLLGYELRAMANRDFQDDDKDSGEIGVGQQMTALYELIMADAPEQVKAQETAVPLKYSKNVPVQSQDILTFKLRYQPPQGAGKAVQQDFPLTAVPAATQNIQWASAVAECSLLLRDSKFKGTANYENLLRRARANLGKDADGKRAEFLVIVQHLQTINQSGSRPVIMNHK